MGAVDATTGAALPWPVNQVVRNAGPDAAIWSLATNGTHVFGTGYTYLVNGGNAGNFEGTFAADASTGALTWVTGCRGDTYGSAPIGGVLYSVGHAHDCSSIGGNPQTNPWSYQRAMGQTIGRGPNSKVNTGGTFNGRPAPLMLHWLPTVSAGSYTGMTQGAWSVTGNANYVVLGGEFPSVNGTAQQGLVRFALRAIAPNRQGPQGTAELKPTVAGAGSGSLLVTWRTAWDRDNKRLTYEVLRGSTVIATRTADTTWWNRPTLSVTDSGLPPGTAQTYRVRARDPLGNTVTSASTSGTPAAAAVAATTDVTRTLTPDGETPAAATAGEYRLLVTVAPSGAVTSRLVKVVDGMETALTPATELPGLTAEPGTRLSVRVQATGTSPTTLRSKVWPATSGEPAGWQATATDATPSP
jgi:hypothetical protein